MNKQQKIIVSIVGITIVLLALLGITYAYYLTRIEGNTNTSSISITTADLKLVYGDGNGLVTKENIMPGTTIEKTFTVTNDGNNKVDLYAVYLEELTNTLSRTEDLTYVLECVSTGEDCDGNDGEFPTLAGMIITNSIDTGVTHTYTLTVTYKNEENIDQSIDMGSRISAFVQIYALKDIVDIEGSVNGTEDGDFAQINSVQKRSQIVNGKYKFAGVLPGTHKIKICSKTDTNCTSPKLEKEIMVNLGNTSGVDGNKITITDNSQTVTIDIDLTQVNIENKVIIGTTIKEMESTIKNPFAKGTLAYNILNNAINSTGTESTKYSAVPLTIPGKESSGENERTLSITEDDYGTSYYFRGNVLDNYVEFNNMCWRIVRIEGDGSVKLTLAKQDLCSTITESDTESAFIGYGHMGEYEEDYDERYEIYENTYFMRSELEKWLNGTLNDGITKRFSSESKRQLKSSKICIGDMLTEYNFREEEYDEYGGILDYGGWDFENYDRIVVKKTASVICNANGYTNNSYQIFPMTADEVVFAGATFHENSNFYLLSNTNNKNWWTISTATFDVYPDHYMSFVIGQKLAVFTTTLDYNYGGFDMWGESYYRPAISLINGTQNTLGTGTKNNPYVIN